jgi:thiol-disulfide isomerase/thioredoxin
MRRAFAITGWLMCGLVISSFGQTRATAPFGFDLQGKPVTRLASPGAQAVVLFFLATDCPISNRYVPEIQRLEKEFAGKAVVFWIVYPNATETEVSVLHHRASFGLQGATLVRPEAAMMTLTHPTVTPESVILVPDKAAGEGFRAVYVGRIDDRYVDIGRERPQATRHDLESAITAVLNHQAVAPPGGPPVGCGIVSEAALHPGAGQP